MKIVFSVGVFTSLVIAASAFAQNTAESSFGKFARPANANPVLSAIRGVPFDCPMRKQPVEWEAAGISNAAAVVRNGEVFLLYTAKDWAEDQKSSVITSRIGLAKSADGIRFTRKNAPVLAPAQDDQISHEQEGGCQDPRVVEREDGTYVMIYTQINQTPERVDSATRKMVANQTKATYRLAIATSKDLLHWEKKGGVFEAPVDPIADVAGVAGSIVCQKIGDRLIAAKVNGKYWMYWGGKVVSIATSDDLLHWTPVLDGAGKPLGVLQPRSDHFDNRSVTPGAPALLSGSAIVLLYNAEASKSAKSDFVEGTCSVGEAVFSSTAPANLIRQSSLPVLQPELPFEAVGQNGAGITKATGLVWFKSRWNLYYGASKWRTAVSIADPSGKAIDPPVVRKPKHNVSPVAVSLDAIDRALLRSGWEMIEAPAITSSAESICSPSFDTRQWLDATVPGTVLTTLVEQGVEPDPLFGNNNLRISEKYCRQAYWYRNAFTLPSNINGKRLELGFDGINYAAEVWLNGQKLGEMKGAFIRGKFDITTKVRFDGPNVLVVKILPPPHPGIPHEQSLAEGAGPNGGITMIDGPAFGCTIGWDWIPGIRDRCMGIWQDVTVRATGPVVLGDPKVQTAVPSVDRADVSISLPVTNTSGSKQAGIVKGRLGNLLFEQTVTLDPGKSQTLAFTPSSFPQLSISKPRLWWPNGYGKPELYDLELSFINKDGIRSDSCRMNVGLREMSYDFSRDSSMELIIKVNGQRIFCRGGNWGMDDALKRLDPKRMDAWVRMHRDGNLNMIRNWVAQSTSEQFFQLCDRYGILVWNDFALANPSDGPEPENRNLFCANVEDTVLRFRNHPSIALWCARNESVPSPNFADYIYNTVWKLDTSRLVIPDSAAFGVSGRGPYWMASVQSYFDLARGMKSEQGMPCVPTADSVRTMLDGADLWPISDGWAYHDFCRKGAMGVDGYVRAIGQNFGQAQDIDDFCQKAQILNYERYRAMYEGWGQKMWRGASGLLLWMTHSSWPSTVWQLYAYDLEPTAALFGARKACEPVHIQMDPRKGTVTVVNMALDPIKNGKVEAIVYDLNAKELSRQSSDINVDANSVADTFQLPQMTSDSVQFVSLILRGGNGTVLSRNFYWITKKESDLQSLNQMQKASVTGEMVVGKIDGKPHIDVRIQNPSEHIAFMTKLTLRDGSGKRVLPVFYSDNYVSLLPKESRLIQIDFTDALDLQNLRLDIEGWKVPKVTICAKRQ